MEPPPRNSQGVRSELTSIIIKIYKRSRKMRTRRLTVGLRIIRKLRDMDIHMLTRMVTITKLILTTQAISWRPLRILRPIVSRIMLTSIKAPVLMLLIVTSRNSTITIKPRPRTHSKGKTNNRPRTMEGIVKAQVLCKLYKTLSRIILIGRKYSIQRAMRSITGTKQPTPRLGA